MPKLETLTLMGASGAKYDFNVWDKDTNWTEDLACVYYVSRRYKKTTGQWSHEDIYFGETDCIKKRFTGAKHDKQDCFDRNNYNAISVRSESDEGKRLEIEADLIKAYESLCNG